MVDKSSMSITFSIEDVARFYKEVGDPVDLGCCENDMQKWISYCEEKYPYKGICTVKKWAVVECKCTEYEALLLKERMGLKPFVLNANYVVWDSKARWREGDFACSFYLVDIEENCLFITKNTCYILIGEGHKKSISPAILHAIMRGLSC
jgi:hypothetical protein